MKKIVYVDMDNVLVDFQSGINRLDEESRLKYMDHYDETPGIFTLMDPLEGAMEAFIWLSDYFDTYILSTAPWNNPSGWTDKLIWVKKYLGKPAYKKLILSHHKELNIGSFLIDDRTKNGADRFKGELILFKSSRFPDWKHVMEYLKTRI
jgi:5'(3')-deoxyribonucleotidase